LHATPMLRGNENPANQEALKSGREAALIDRQWI
jgi:hypothetical protein